MSDFEETHSKPSAEAELPPYRQPDTLSQRPSAKPPIWLWPVLAAVLVVGVLLGKYWGNDSNAATDESATSNSVANDQATGSDASIEQSVLSVETVSPSQDDIGSTLSADGTINAKDTANVSAKVNGVAIERILVEEGDRVRAGQVLAVFDTDAMEQQVLQAVHRTVMELLEQVELILYSVR